MTNLSWLQLHIRTRCTRFYCYKRYISYINKYYRDAPQVLETPKMRDEVLKFNDTTSSWEETKEPQAETERKKQAKQQNSFGKSDDATLLIDRRKLEEISILESFGRKEEIISEKRLLTTDTPTPITPSSKVTYKEEQTQSGLSLWQSRKKKTPKILLNLLNLSYRGKEFQLMRTNINKHDIPSVGVPPFQKLRPSCLKFMYMQLRVRAS